MTQPHRMHCLEVDLHNVCNARCPLCHFRSNYPESLAVRHALDLQFFERILDGHSFERIHIAGDLGEPTLSPHILPVIRFLKERAPRTFICINTHGGARDHAFWQSLADALPGRHEVVFAIDGLADTYSTYRVGLDFERTLGNATAFITAGGIASWSFIKFQHNQHQVEEARRLAHEMEFAAFHERDSYAESDDFQRAGDYSENHRRIASLAADGKVRVVPNPFPYIQADKTLYPCAPSNCGRYDDAMDFDFSQLDLGSRSLAECLGTLPSYCRAMQETYPLTCVRRCGQLKASDKPRGAEIGYGRRVIPATSAGGVEDL